MRILPFAALACAVMLAPACSAPSNGPEEQVAVDAEPASRTQSDPAETSAAPAPDGSPSADASVVDTGDGNPDVTPAPLDPAAEKGEKGARNVLLAFIRAIELGEYGQAHDLMRDNARANTSAKELARRFEGFGTVTVAAPSGMMEGAAGTLYYTAPVTVTGSNGQRVEGEIVLSRVNDVPGATPEQLQWRVRQFDLTAR
tara:strand:+ start:1184 stop:1783 length:600 start_codon:yes stop_codon:yes gene_type:complete